MELANPLTKARADLFYDGKLLVDFDFSDVLGGSVVIGTCIEGRVVSEVALLIEDDFDGGVAITIGDDVAQARFQAVADNNPEKVNTYQASVHHEYTSDTEIKVFFPAGAPTKGSGRAIVYLA